MLQKFFSVLLATFSIGLGTTDVQDNSVKGPAFITTSAQEQWADSVLLSLSQEEKIGQLFMDFGGEIKQILHDYATFNWIMTGTDTFAVEGTSFGEHKAGAWRAGVSHAGRWCDVFEIRDFLIQRCFIYLDPDYTGRDTARYPWLAAGGRDASKPMGS